MGCRSTKEVVYTELKMVEIRFPNTLYPTYCMLVGSRAFDIKWFLEEDLKIAHGRFELQHMNHLSISNEDTILSMLPRYHMPSQTWRVNLRLEITKIDHHY